MIKVYVTKISLPLYNNSKKKHLNPNKLTYTTELQFKFIFDWQFKARDKGIIYIYIYIWGGWMKYDTEM